MKRPTYIQKPFHRLPLKQRAIFILHLAGFSCREIERATETDHVTVSRLISTGYEEHREEIETILPIYEGHK